MRFFHEEDKILVVFTEEVNDVLDFFARALEVYTALQFPNIENHPGKKEFEFLVYTLFVISLGIEDFTSPEAIEVYGEFDPALNTNRKVRARLNKLEKKMWFRKQNTRYYILPRVERIAKSKEMKIDFELKLNRNVEIN